MSVFRKSITVANIFSYEEGLYGIKFAVNDK